MYRLNVLNKLMPEFYEHLPEDEKGKFIAEVSLRVPEFGHESILHKKNRKKFTSYRKAYYWVRFRALLRDITSSFYAPDYGVQWKIIEDK